MMFALLLLAHLHGFALQTTIPISPLPWFGITLVVALVVMFVCAAIYMIAPMFGSGGMRQWSLFQLYEAILSIALIVLFLGIVGLFFLNPQSGFASAGLVPQGCTNATTIYTLSACDLSQFNTASYNVASTMWAFAVIKAIIPNSNLAIQPVPQEGDGVEIGFTIPNLLDGWNGQIINGVLKVMLTALLVSQIQLILLSSSLLLLSFFFTVGLVARVFGFSRTFGGAMIAFGIGLGIIYPLLIAITYGYVDVAAGTYTINQIGACLSSPVNCAASAAVNSLSQTTFSSAFFSIFISPFAPMFALGPNVTSSVFTTVVGAAASPLQTLAGAIVFVFQEIGYIIAGLTIIPVINIIIVDVFIIDFSRAVGEQMSFQMLFQGLI